MTFAGIVACVAAFALLALVAVVKAVDSGRLAGEKSIAMLFLPLVGTLLILASGLFFRNRPAMIFLPYLGMGSVLVLAGYSVYRLRHVWITASLVAITITIASLWCWFLSGMAITDNWL